MDLITAALGLLAISGLLLVLFWSDIRKYRCQHDFMCAEHRSHRFPALEPEGYFEYVQQVEIMKCQMCGEVKFDDDLEKVAKLEPVEVDDEG